MVAEEEEEDDEADEGLDGMDGGEVAPIVSGAGCPLDGRLLQPVMKQLRSRRDGVEPRGIVVGWQRIRESPSDLPVYALLAPPEPVPSCDPACLSHGGLTGVLAGGAPPPSGRHLSSRTRLERRGVWPKKCRLSSCPEREVRNAAAKPSRSIDTIAHDRSTDDFLRAVDAHASNLLALPGGHLLCAWFSGHEGSGATQWEPGVRISGEAGRSAQNPVLFQDTSPTGNGTGRVHLLHTSQLAGKGQEYAIAVLAVVLFGVPHFGACCRHGHLGTSEIWHLHSDDDGATWSPAVILTTEGFQRKGVFLRNQLLKQHFVKGRSEEEWLLPMYYTPGGLQTHHSGIQALRLASGAIVLVFNNIRTKIRRDPLSVALSTDGGKSWPYVRGGALQHRHVAAELLCGISRTAA
eukprot:gene6840-8170_t